MREFCRLSLRAALIVIAASCLGLAANAVSPRGISLTKDYNPPAPPPPSPSMTLNIEELLKLYKTPGVVLVDAREKSVYDQGHIPGAVSLPVATDAEVLDDCVPFLQDKTVVTYCSGAHCSDSTELADHFMEHGLATVKIFHGGWEQWTALGQPIETGPGKSVWELLGS